VTASKIGWAMYLAVLVVWTVCGLVWPDFREAQRLIFGLR